MIEDILAYNKRFVAEKGYEKYITNKYPDKKIAILSCMDTRLTALLPAALGIKNGDVKMIKTELKSPEISHGFFRSTAYKYIFDTLQSSLVPDRLLLVLAMLPL